MHFSKFRPLHFLGTQTKLNNRWLNPMYHLKGGQTYFSQIQLTLSHTQMLWIRLEISHDSHPLGLGDMAEMNCVMFNYKQEVLKIYWSSSTGPKWAIFSNVT